MDLTPSGRCWLQFIHASKNVS